MTTSRTRLAAGVAIVLLLGFGGHALYSRWSEPRFEGKRLSAWFDEFCLASQRLTWSFDRHGRTLYVSNASLAPDPAQRALQSFGPPAAAFLTRQVSAGSLGTESSYGKLYRRLPPQLQRQLPNPNAQDQRRLQAVIALAGMGAANQDSVDAVLKFILDGPPFTRRVAISLLPAFQGSDARIEKLVRDLMKAKRYGDVQYLLGNCPANTPGIAQHVAEIIKEDAPGNLWALRYLGASGEKAREVVPLLATCLASTNREVRYQTTLALEEIGPAARDAVPALTRCLSDEHSMVQSAARRALAAIQRNEINTANAEQ